MTEPILRRGEWWYREKDGSWVKWVEASASWERQAGPPPPPEAPSPQLAESRPRTEFTGPAEPARDDVLPIVAGGAGVVSVIGSFLAWGESESWFQGQRTVSAITGLELDYGWGVLLAGIAVTVVATLRLTAGGRRILDDIMNRLDEPWRWIRDAAPMVLGFCILLLAGLGYQRMARDYFDEYRPVLGLWLVLVGGFACVLAGMIAMRGTPDR